MNVRKLTYFRPKEGPIGDVLAEFFKNLEETLEEDGCANLHLEPGDGTKYQFLITNLNENDRLISCFMGLSNFSIAVAKYGIAIPTYLREKMPRSHNANCYTVGLACEILRLIANATSVDIFYDWQDAKPTYVWAS